MIDYSQYTVEQLNIMVNQEANQTTKLINENKYIPIERMMRVADLMETIGHKYIEYADDLRKGKVRDFK